LINTVDVGQCETIIFIFKIFFTGVLILIGLLRRVKPKVGDIAVAETTKLSVGKVLDKLRKTDVSESKFTRLDERIETLSQETQRLRAARQRLERNQKASSAKRD